MLEARINVLNAVAEFYVPPYQMWTNTCQTAAMELKCTTILCESHNVVDICACVHWHGNGQWILVLTQKFATNC